jgi:hypothetical protein
VEPRAGADPWRELRSCGVTAVRSDVGDTPEDLGEHLVEGVELAVPVDEGHPPEPVQVAQRRGACDRH